MNKRRIISLFLIFVLLFSAFPVLADQEQNIGDGVVKIVRDHYGVPHIYAGNAHDLYRAYGYVMAQDRLFQLEMFKRGNAGTVSAVLGEKYLQRDQRLRRDGYTDAEIQEMIAKMEPFTKEVIHHFAEGISLYVQEALEDPDEKLSKEFHDYQFRPDKWTEVDVLRLFMSSITSFMDSEQEVTNAALLTALTKKHGTVVAQQMFNDIIWLDDPAAPTSSPSTGSINPVKEEPQINSKQLSKGIEKVAQDMQGERENYVSTAKELGLPLTIGSNALIIAPEKSATGHALLMGGPQAGFTAPGFIYEVGLHAPGIDIQGSSFIGWPAIMFGATEHFAFTTTYGYGNDVDIFEEKLNPDNPTQYLFNGEWVDMEKRVETFQVRNQEGVVEEVTKEFYRTIHGPIIYVDEQNHMAYSKKWGFRGSEMQSWSALVKTNWAKNIDDFAKAVREFTMSVNFFYIDKLGNTAFYHGGRYPLRAEGVDLRLPTPGTGEYEWQGYLAPEKNPHALNPDIGFVANWNNKPAPNWNNGETTYVWGGDNRVQQFIDLVQAKEKLTLADVDAINYQASFVNLKTRWFKSYLLEALKNNKDQDSRYPNVYTYLSNWNNLNEDVDADQLYDTPAITIFEAWWPIFHEQVFRPHLGDTYDSVRGLINHSYGAGLLLRILQGKEAELPVGYKWVTGEGEYQQIMLNSLNEALDSLEKKYKTQDMSKWLTPMRTMTFGDTSLIGVQHGLGAQIPIPEMNRGSENHYVEMTADGPTGFNITPPGQIGFIKKDGTQSKHYIDQVEMFANWEYKSILFYEKDVLEQAASIEYVKVQKK